MKFGYSLVTFLAVVSSSPAWSDTATGVIKTVTFNGDYTQRGACIQMDPALDGTQWACVYRNQSYLFSEINAVILAARVSGVVCSIAWTSLSEENHKVIRYVQC